MRDYDNTPFVNKINMSYGACQEFAKWYRNAKSNEKYCYYSGLPISMGNTEDGAVKTIAWKYAISGWVYLVQKRMGNNYFEYIAIKSNEKLDKLIPLDYDQKRKYVKASAKVESNGQEW